jgi:hypothetical protein
MTDRELASQYAARIAAQNEVVDLKERLTRADVEMQRAVMAERERCAKLCTEWARICDSGKRHGAKIGAQECAKLIRTVDDADAA